MSSDSPTQQNGNASKDGKRKPAADKDEAGIGGLSVLDFFRVLAGVILLNCVLSYYITGKNVLWGYRPWYTRTGPLKAWMNGPILLTDEQLAAYDGTDPALPIYLGLNGTIYDVTAGRPMYGPGGSYSFFAGRDAARAFVTGCFQEDLNADLRGAEETYMPADSPVDVLLEQRGGEKATEVKFRRERERRVAKKQVDQTLEGWAKLFRGDSGKPYYEVGQIVRDPNWLKKVPRKQLCARAKKQRQQRRAEQVS